MTNISIPRKGDMKPKNNGTAKTNKIGSGNIIRSSGSQINNPTIDHKTQKTIHVFFCGVKKVINMVSIGVFLREIRGARGRQILQHQPSF